MSERLKTERVIMETREWYTLAELAQVTDLPEADARNFVKKCGDLLRPHNFGDIVKYPAPVADLLTRFTSLRQQGWTIEDLKNLLIITRQEIQKDGQDNRSDLLLELQQESATLLKNLEIIMNFWSQMQGAFRSIVSLMTNFESLVRRMLDQEKELSELRAKGSS